MIIPGIRDGSAKEIGVQADRANGGREEGEELRVGVWRFARLEKVLAIVGGHGPVVVLARAVDAPEGLLVQQGG